MGNTSHPISIEFVKTIQKGLLHLPRIFFCGKTIGGRIVNIQKWKNIYNFFHVIKKAKKEH